MPNFATAPPVGPAHHCLGAAQRGGVLPLEPLRDLPLPPGTPLCAPDGARIAGETLFLPFLSRDCRGSARKRLQLHVLLSPPARPL